MAQTTTVILGIPIDNITMDEAVAHIFAMINDYAVHKKPRQVATVNVDFVVNTLAWGLKHIRHPELLNILRRADLVTADGMPLVWASRLLGTPLKERVTGADLVPRLAQEAARRGKSIYFLGGRGDSGKKAAALLRDRYPQLVVAGAQSPFVHVEGEPLLEAQENDLPIVEQINRSGADILLIGFGNPKQEVWFERNRNRLRVPVSIGIGGTYEFILGSVARAPVWMQKTGLEWIFRITQDPLRLWKRYFVGFFKFGLLVLPAIFYQRYRRLWFKLFGQSGQPPSGPAVSASQPEGAPVNVVTLPPSVDAATVARTKIDIETAAKGCANTVLDFDRVAFIDSSGLGMLIALWRAAKESQGDLYLTNISAGTRRFFELSRVADLFRERIFTDLNETLTHISKGADQPPFYYHTTIRAETVIFDLSGALDAAQMAALDMDAVIGIMDRRDCIFNLQNLSFVDSSGIMFFLKIQRQATKQGRVCRLAGLQANVLQMFRITKLDRLFKISRDTAAAIGLLETLRTKNKSAGGA